MTVIAGVVSVDGVVIGADRMSSNCSHKSTDAHKILERDGWAFANTGNPRTLQIFERFTRKKRLQGLEDVCQLADDFYGEMTAKGLGIAKSEEVPGFDSAFLIALPGELFCLDRNFGVYQYKEFAANGIGYEYALGVIYDGYGKVQDVELVERAINAANAMNPHCGGGPDIIRVSNKEEKVSITRISTERGKGARK